MSETAKPDRRPKPSRVGRSGARIGAAAAGADGEAQGRRVAIVAVVVAAGMSRRMNGRDKLEANLRGRPILRWSVEALAAAGVERIVIVTAPARVATVAAAAWLPEAVVAVVAGGERRQESVAAGVAALAAMAGDESPDADPVVLIHDAARPLVSPDLVRAVAASAASHGAAIPVQAVAETLKHLDGERVGYTVDRTDVVAAQTPQAVRRSLLERAYAAYPPDGPEIWTDEAALLEACRIPVHAVAGEPSNIKVTVPADIDIAEALLDRGLAGPLSSLAAQVAGEAGSVAEPVAAAQDGWASAESATPGPVRIGLGSDSHPFGPGDTLALGGLRIDGAPRLQGHSDGDVAIHAVADALLGAAGLGDLGRLFPSDVRTPSGIDSRVLLASVVRAAEEAGWRPANVDLTIVAARPRLGELLPRMGEAIAEIVGLAPSAVNVKASSGNLNGPEGAGRAVSAVAVVTVAGLARQTPVGEGAGARRHATATPEVLR